MSLRRDKLQRNDVAANSALIQKQIAKEMSKGLNYSAVVDHSSLSPKFQNTSYEFNKNNSKFKQNINKLTNDKSFTNIDAYLPQNLNKIEGFDESLKFRTNQRKPQTAANPGQRKIKQTQSPPEQEQFQKMTAVQQARVDMTGFGDNFQEQNFEVRLKELTTVKDQSIKLNVNVIETWVNETLSDAEHLDIPGVILKPDHKNPISRYNIDRITLTNNSIPSEKVDRIYRALFVYSIGFYEMLARTLHNAENKYTILSNIWRVFSILLEYCCKSNYQMMIAKIAKEHKEELERIEKQFNEQMSQMAENEKKLINNLDELRKKQLELEKQKEEEMILRKRVEDEFNKNIQNHEEEVQLRLKFESKLNSMHALHRDLQSKYQRSLEDIYNLENANQDYYNILQSMKTELIDLKSEKVESEAKIVYQSERIKQLVHDNELKLRQVNDLELKVQKANAEIENKNLLQKENERQINETRLKLEANKSLIDGLTSEKNHIELTLKEYKDQKDQYFEKSERLSKLYEETFEKMQEFKKQIVGIDEIKKDRDDRIEKLRQEYEELHGKFESVENDHTKLKVQHDFVSNDHNNLKVDFDSVNEKLKIANKARNDKEEQLNDKVKQCLYQQDIIRDKDYQVDKLKREVEKTRKRLNEVEKQNDALEIKKKSLDKQAEIQRKQLLDKIANLNELVSAEKDTREMWINRFEKEQKSHVSTNAELLHTKSILQDIQLQLKNSEVQLNSSNKSNMSLKEVNEELQAQLSKYMANSETFERDLYTKNQLLKNVEDQQKVFNFQLREEYKKDIEEKEKELLQRQMEYEDLRSRAEMYFRSNIELEMRVGKAELTVGAQETQIKTLEYELDGQKERAWKLNQDIKDVKEQLGEEQSKNEQSQAQIGQMKEQNEQLNEEITSLIKVIKEKESNERIQEYQSIEQNTISEVNNSIDNVQVVVPTQESKGNNQVQLLQRGTQTRSKRVREQEIQTEFILQMTSLSPNQLMQMQQMPQSQNQKRPRIVSAVNTNNSTMGQSNMNYQQEFSNGDQSSAILNQSNGDTNDYNLQINVGNSQQFLYDFDRVKSAAHKYRHNVPGPNDTIQEESELQLNQGKSTKMFKRNINLEDQEDEEQMNTLRKTSTDKNNYRSSEPPNQYRVNSLQGHIKSSSFYPNPLKKHKYAFRIKDEDERRQKSSDRTDIMSNEMLKSVYEKRVTTKGIKRLPPQIMNSTSSRPGTQPHGYRKDNFQAMNLHPLDRVDQIFTPSENTSSSVHGNRILMMSLGGGSRPMTKSSERAQSSKGRASIKALIKGASTREQ